MILLAVSALVGMLAGGLIEHHRIVRKMRSEFSQIRGELFSHLDSIKDKSEIMVRHDACAFRDRMSTRVIKWLS